MAFNSSSSCVREDVNKAKLKLVIPNFSKVVAKTTKGQEINSKQFDVGGEEAVVSCPTCKTAFMGRDFGMEAFIRDLSEKN